MSPALFTSQYVWYQYFEKHDEELFETHRPGRAIGIHLIGSLEDVGCDEVYGVKRNFCYLPSVVINYSCP